MRSYLSFLLIPFLGFGVFAGKTSASPPEVQSGFNARLSYLEGDVRLSLGRDGAPHIGKEWVDASAGTAVEEGYSLATQEGSAEIELENGSMLYLAPHSLLMFYDLTAHDPDASGTKEFDTVGTKLLAGSLMFSVAIPAGWRVHAGNPDREAASAFHGTVPGYELPEQHRDG